MQFITKNKFTSLSLILISIVIIWSCFNLKLWNKRPIEMDVFSYYIYLPAFFIEKDPKFNFQGDPEKPQYDHLWYVYSTNGNKITKMGIGISYLYAPFFFIGHIIAPVFKYPQNGLSKPYIISLIFGSIFYSITGLYITGKILLLYFPDITSGITIALIGLGTNFLYYSTLEPLIPHIFNYFLLGSFIYLTIKWHKHPSISLSALSGLLLGIILVARPTNAIILLFPLLYSIYNLATLKHKIRMIKEHFKNILIFIVFFLLPVLPQILYWKYVTGDFFYYSYNNEKFFFTHPYIIEGLVGFRKGWLLYTPVMIFALIGIYFVYKKLPALFLGIFIFTILNIYVIYSWWCWWYGGSFSSRPMIDSYPLMAIPLACSVVYFMKKKSFIRTLSFILIGCLPGLNVFQTYQYKNNVIHYDGMTKEAYFAVFGKLSQPDNFYNLIKQPDYENAVKTGNELN